MLFSEIYGSYFHVVASVLTKALEKNLTDRELTELVQEKAFSESILSIPSAIKQNDWKLFKADLKPVLRHKPTLPLTTLQKRWLKALLLDPRIQLFAPDTSGLENVEPLYKQDTFVFFDQYNDGDPYEDENYIKNFRLIMKAICEKKMLHIHFRSRAGICHSITCLPYRLEYSSKDDKFRLLSLKDQENNIINLARIDSCKIAATPAPVKFDLPQNNSKELILLLNDERNALERVLLHFSHFEKETIKLENEKFQIKLFYDKDDEAELLIRVLSFGPVLEVKAPQEFIDLITYRIQKQLQFRMDTSINT